MARIELLVALAGFACASPAPRKRDAPVPPAERFVTLAAPATRNARIVIDNDAWLDITVAGDDRRSQRLCEVVAARRLRSIQAVKPELEITRPCAAEPLPPVRARDRHHLLVTTDTEDELVLVYAAVNVETNEPGEPAIATVTQFARFARADACEKALAMMAAETASADEEVATNVRQFLENEATRARERAAKDCASADEEGRKCAAARKNERVICETQRDQRVRECTDAREGVERLEAELARPRPRPEPTPAICRAE